MVTEDISSEMVGVMAVILCTFTHVPFAFVVNHMPIQPWMLTKKSIALLLSRFHFLQ